jgi:ATP-dependent helicase HrpA
LGENRQRIVEVLALEHRVRRDLLVGDDALEAFFDERLPAEVTTGRRFDRWWREERGRSPDLLAFTVEDLVDAADGPVDLALFPEWVRVADVDLPLTYVHDPGAELDGVSIDVPLLLLDAVEEAHLDWQVPGHRGELVESLIRTLPKDVRRHVGPPVDAARRVLAEVGPGDGPLLVVLGQALTRIAGASIRFASDALDQVPPHLRLTYRAVDDRGRPLAWSKDLGALRRRMAARLRAALAEAAPLAEIEGLRSWTIGEIPRTVEAEHAGTRVVGYPALVDEGRSVALRVLPTEAEQRHEMWLGTTRLLLLQLGSPLRTLDRALPKATKLALAGSSRMSAAAVYVEAAAAAVDHLLLQAGGPVWDEGAFKALLARVKERFTPTAVGAAAQIADVLATAAAIEGRLAVMLAPRFDDTVIDAQAQMARLLRPGWITLAGVDRLADVARYMRALEHRLTKAVAQPDRDRSRLASVRALEQEYASLAWRDRDGSVRTMLEELRVATFAQSVGARGGPSEQKLRKALSAL